MDSCPPSPVANPDAALFALERPDRSLLVYYSLVCLPTLVFPPLTVVIWLVYYFRYHTLRYRFDEEGVSMRWGILFRREIILNFARIQDIHLTSNVVERWLGLARIQIQTASGSATPEMTLEGLREFEAVRNFLYRRMRGTHDRNPRKAPGPSIAPDAIAPAPLRTGDDAALAAVLREVTAEVRALRAELESRRTP